MFALIDETTLENMVINTKQTSSPAARITDDLIKPFLLLLMTLPHIFVYSITLTYLCSNHFCGFIIMIRERTEEEMSTVIIGLLIPFVGTAAGSACVFFLKDEIKSGVQRALTGFAAGVMVAASIWSLIVPAIEQSEDMGRFAFAPAFMGFWAGILFLLLLDHIIPHLHVATDETEGPRSQLTRTAMLVLAVTLHNIPEGMAVGVVYAGLVSGSSMITAGGALALALGIAIQNFPEGAIISMPLYAEGKNKGKSFILGVASGAVEPVFGGLTVILAALIVPAMPYLLSFAAGAMLYVVVEELIPEMSAGEHSNIGVISFAVGFSLMMALDVALG